MDNILQTDGTMLTMLQLRASILTLALPTLVLPHPVVEHLHVVIFSRFYLLRFNANARIAWGVRLDMCDLGVMAPKVLLLLQSELLEGDRQARGRVGR